MDLTLGVIICVVLGIILLRFAVKVMFKILGFVLILLAVLAFMYLYSWGPFEKNITSIHALEAKYCEEDGDPDICECIVSKLKLDVISIG